MQRLLVIGGAAACIGAVGLLIVLLRDGDRSRAGDDSGTTSTNGRGDVERSRSTATPKPVPRRQSSNPRRHAINAAMADYETRAAERDAIVEGLRRSGTSREEWTEETIAAYRRVFADFAGAVEVSPADCYAAGCIAELTYRDAKAFEEVSTGIEMNRTLDQWPMIFSGPDLREDGSVVNVFVLLKPQPELSK